MKKHLFFTFIIAIIGALTSCNNQSNNKEQLNGSDSTQTNVIEDSLEYLTNRIKTHSNNIEVWKDRSDYFFRQGDLNNAAIDMSRAVELDTNNIENLNKYAELLMAILEIKTALNTYNHILRIDSLNAKAYVGVGTVYAYLNNPGLATGYLNKAYAIDPHISEAYFLEGLIYRSDFYDTKREESWKRSLSSFQTAIEQNPNYFLAYMELGYMHNERGNPIALDYFNSAIAVYPESTVALYNKAMILQNPQQYMEAQEVYRQIITIDSTFEDAYYNQGYIKLSYEKEYDSAVYFFNQAIDINNQNENSYNNLGLALEYQGDYEGAKNAYRKAIEINPDFKLAKKNLSIVSKK